MRRYFFIAGDGLSLLISHRPEVDGFIRLKKATFDRIAKVMIPGIVTKHDGLYVKGRVGR